MTAATRSHRIALAVGLLLFCAGCTRRNSDVDASRPPQGGRKLLESIDSAMAVVGGRIAGPRRLDTTGYEAFVHIDQAFTGALHRGDSARIAWEELSPIRPPRLKEGDRLVVALQELPTSSLWRQRIPKGEAYIVAAAGEGFVLHPDAPTLATLAAFLALPPQDRRSAAGQAALAALIARAAPDVAVGAADLLLSFDPSTPLADEAATALASGLEREQVPPLRPAILELATRYRSAPLRSAVARIAESDGPYAYEAWMALTAMDGNPSEAMILSFLADGRGAKRRAGVRLARNGTLEAVLPLLRNDPDPQVRAAAARALIDQRNTSAMTDVLRALGDPSPAVRTEAARALGSLGPAVVPTLLDLARGASPETALAVVLALEAAGPAGVAALHELAEQHHHPSVRRLAGLSLGELEDAH